MRYLLAALLILTPAAAQDGAKDSGTWKAGFGRADVTPDRPVWMSGYSSRKKPSDGVEGRIFVKAMALEDAGGTRAVLVTTDFAGIWSFFTDPVVEAVSAKTGLKRDQFLFTCSHNHSGPSLSLNASARGNRSKEDAENTVRYTRECQEKLTKAVLDAVSDLKPARLSRGTGVAPFVMNRREFTPRGIILGHNPRGLADRSVPVLRVEGRDGDLRGVVFGAACHNTTLGSRNYKITGDFAGFAQEHLEKKLAGVQAMFVSGCGGDANPYPRHGDAALTHARTHGKTLGDEVLRVLESKLSPVAGPLRIATTVAKLPFQSNLSVEKLRRVAEGRQRSPASNARSLLAILERGGKLPTHQDAPVSVWRFGEDLTLAALSGEVVVDFVPLIEKEVGPLRLWIVAYAHELFGYVTSARVQKEGGYEAKGIYGKGLFAYDAQDVYVGAVRKLAEEVGRVEPR